MKRKNEYLFLVIFLGVFGLLIGGRYLVAFPTIPQPKNPNTIAFTDTVSWDMKLSHPYVLKGSNGEVMLNLKIRGQDIKSPERAPVNLVLVIDRSGSMDEAGKIEYAKEAAKRIISGLGSVDRLAIVAYSTDVQLLYPIQFLNNKDTAISIVDSLYPTDSTNLGGGLIAGIDQLKSLGKNGYINRVILLSDGLANIGITDIGELSRIASGAAENGIHITTMGLGVNYDENLMTSVAEYGAGNYYFIESPNQLASIFEKEFGQMLAAVAKDTTVYLSLAPGVQLNNVYGYAHALKDGKVQIKLGDLSSGQERNIFIKLNAPVVNLGKQELVKASLEFTDILKNNQPVKMQKELAYEVTEDKTKVAANEDKDVVARGISVDAAYDMYRATEEYERDNKKGALDAIGRALKSISDLNLSPYRTEATIKQEKELRGAMEEMSVEAPAPQSDAGKGLIKNYKAKAREQQK